MKTTNRKFQEAYNYCDAISKGELKIFNKKTEEMEEIVEKGSALAYAAKRFFDKNEKRFRKLLESVNDIGFELCSTEKDTGNIDYLLNGNRKDFKFTPEKQKEYNKRTNEILDIEIELTKDELFICPKEKLPNPVPFELEVLNGFILDHKFWDTF